MPNLKFVDNTTQPPQGKVENIQPGIFNQKVMNLQKKLNGPSSPARALYLLRITSMVSTTRYPIADSFLLCMPLV